MPTLSRQALRQTLGTRWLHDTYVGSVTTGSGSAAGSLYALDNTQGDPAFSGEQLWNRAWLKVNGMELRVSSFNCASGAWLTQQLAATLIGSGATLEAHQLLSPSDKDRALDDTVKRLRLRREVGLPSVDQAQSYVLDAAASPDTISDVLNVYYFTNTAQTINRDVRYPLDFEVVSTGSASFELRVQPALGASQWITIDAIVVPTLGAADTATVNIPGPNDRFVLSGAAAVSYDMIMRNAVGQEMQKFAVLRQDAAREFTRLSARYRPSIDRKITLDDPVGGKLWPGVWME